MSLQPVKQTYTESPPLDPEMMCQCSTPLTTITIKILNGSDPFIEVAKAVICRRCHYLKKGWLLPAAKKLNITGANVRACLKASHNSDLFNILELHAGKVKINKPSPQMEKYISAREKERPRVHTSYDPNKFLEPETQELPL